MSSLLYASCDATSARVEKAGSRLDAKIVVVSTIPGWADSAFVDGSVVNVGLPAIGRSFQGGAADLAPLSAIPD